MHTFTCIWMFYSTTALYFAIGRISCLASKHKFWLYYLVRIFTFTFYFHFQVIILFVESHVLSIKLNSSYNIVQEFSTVTFKCSYKFVESHVLLLNICIQSTGCQNLNWNKFPPYKLLKHFYFHFVLSLLRDTIYMLFDFHF